MLLCLQLFQISALEGLEAGGSTAGGEGINAAYAAAETMYSDKANNRVILATDGNFNVGESSETGLFFCQSIPADRITKTDCLTMRISIMIVPMLVKWELDRPLPPCMSN